MMLDNKNITKHTPYKWEMDRFLRNGKPTCFGCGYMQNDLNEQPSSCLWDWNKNDTIEPNLDKNYPPVCEIWNDWNEHE